MPQGPAGADGSPAPGRARHHAGIRTGVRAADAPAERDQELEDLHRGERPQRAKGIVLKEIAQDLSKALGYSADEEVRAVEKGKVSAR